MKNSEHREVFVVRELCLLKAVVTCLHVFTVLKITALMICECRAETHELVNLLTPTVAIWDTGTAIKHSVPDRVKLSFVIFDIWAL